MNWYSLHPDLESLDQGTDDVPSSPGVTRWGEVGPEVDGWSWTIMAMDTADDQWEEASGRATTEEEAKAAVESYRP